MLSGRRAVDKNRPNGEHNLVEWAKPYLANKRKIFRVVDNRLEGQYVLDVAHTVANLALRCLSTEPKSRPKMDEVVKELEQLQGSKETRQSTRRNASSGARPRKRTPADVCKGSVPAAYPRPSASPLYAKWNREYSICCTTGVLSRGKSEALLMLHIRFYYVSVHVELHHRLDVLCCKRTFITLDGWFY